MADEKVIKIVTEVGGSLGPDPVIRAQQEAAAQKFREQQAVAQAAAKERAWIQQQLSPQSFATAPWTPAQGGSPNQPGGRRGRPRSPYTPPPAPPFPPGGGSPKAPPIPGGGQQGPSGIPSSFGKDAYKQLQKFVSAIDGVNGHLTKLLAALSRAHDFLTNIVKNRAVIIGGMKNLGAMNVTLTGVMGTAAAAVGVLALGAKLTSKLFENLQEVVEGFSGALQAAKSQTEITLVRARLRSASRIGGELASLERVNSDIKEELIELKTNIIDGIYPLIQQGAANLVTLLKVVNFVLKVQTDTWETMERLIEIILELATHVPILGKAAKKALDWMRQDDINSINAATPLNKQIEDLFDPSNVFPEKPKKNSIPQRFLP